MSKNNNRAAKCTQVSGSSLATEDTRRKETMSRAKLKGNAKNGETSHLEEEDAEKKKSVA
jgi:hypothetical protein